mmetsp:Transcript_34040/g.76897  ORF Transcript_34040/g.76897 Transcript_34040/m.76897 type:complete len:203 (-) Transcript_34040:2152-2760(-)
MAALGKYFSDLPKLCRERSPTPIFRCYFFFLLEVHAPGDVADGLGVLAVVGYVGLGVEAADDLHGLANLEAERPSRAAVLPHADPRHPREELGKSHEVVVVVSRGVLLDPFVLLLLLHEVEHLLCLSHAHEACVPDRRAELGQRHGVRHPVRRRVLLKHTAELFCLFVCLFDLFDFFLMICVFVRLVGWLFGGSAGSAVLHS